MHFVLLGNYRRHLFQLLAFLLRYGPKSIDEILNRSTRFNIELAAAIAEIMGEEKAACERNMMTGES